jgi:pimeloyl-ACP methyl ester carboxylesterase
MEEYGIFLGESRIARMHVRRGFVDIAEGQVHYRAAGEGGLPLVMLHASPGSSLMLVPLIRELAKQRRVIAPDTLGNGDSAAPPSASAAIADFADAHLRALAALGIERFDLYGSHTGGNIACEMAIAAPGRVRRLVLDGMSLYAPDEQAEMLRDYAREYPPRADGTHLLQVWSFVRDAYLFWPWYRQDAAHRRDVGVPPPAVLHEKTVEVLKALGTYHIPYRAALGYDKAARLPLVTVPTLLACARTDMLLRYFDAVAALMPAADKAITPGVATPADAAATARLFGAFLDGRGQRRGAALSEDSP